MSDNETTVGRPTPVEFLENIVKPLVADPDAVKVEQVNDDRGVLLVLNVAQADMGRVLGKGGEMADSIRRVLRGYGFNINARISMRIQEPEGSTHFQDREL